MILVAAVSPIVEPLVADYRRTRDVTVLAPRLVPADLALRIWARGKTDRRYLGDFARRAALDVWFAREVRRLRPETVIACSLGARCTFAAAKSIGARTMLVLDLPLFRALHRDLDRAATHWPERSFLRRFRAPSWAIARQEAERVLADLVFVRGPYARSICLADGIAPQRLSPLPARATVSIATPARPTHRIRLAGLAAARHGIDTALEAARIAGKTLVVRIGDGTEPSNLRQLGVATDDAPVDAVICPAVCETYAPELRITGIPVIASPMASLDGTGPDPYDASAFAAAFR
ncbi:MAG: hypothetical protein M4D80_02460 [Myxococcota bacterium]|nr:hypothetical protein [Myxococcota bacterium]